MSEKLLFIDTETTGLFNFKEPADAPGQPRLASLAGILCDGKDIVSSVEFLIKPDDWAMTKEASAINGLTDDGLSAFGVPVKVVLEWYDAMLSLNPTIISHNVKFDTKVMRGELRRAGMLDRFTTTKTFCTMRQAAKLMGKGITVSLKDAVRYFMSEDVVGAHNAIHDVRYCKALYFTMQEKADEVLAHA